MSHSGQTKVQPTPSLANRPSADFLKPELEAALWQKAYRIIHEKALQCPCKGKATNQQSNCKNCGGTGWVFINPTLTRAILHSMNLNTDYKSWSQQNIGTVSITVRDIDQLSFMDRITVVDNEGLFNEVRHISKRASDNKLFTFTSYNIKEVVYAGIFDTVNTVLTRLTLTTDFTIDDNKFFLTSSWLNTFNTKNGDLSVTLLYKHNPQFYVIDMGRELMNSWFRDGQGEHQIKLPVNAIGRRAHYILDANNLTEDRILDNSFKVDPCVNQYISKVC